MRLNRPIARRPQRIKIYIFMEGSNTEPVYFKSYERHVANSRIDLHCEKERGVPKTLLSLAKDKFSEISSKRYIRENGKNDQVWIVFDRDEHEDVKYVLDTCKEIGIKTAFSNPCFELWLILHFVDYDKDEHRHQTQKFCESICIGYEKDKRKLPEMSALMPNVENAENRAEIMEKRRSEDGAEAPLTTVYRLTKVIRNGPKLPKSATTSANKKKKKT
ncbi:RloB family protein [Komagataeibacter oboediens]|uniref:RloB family protein n=1 Tax=Komagataeibacter oboediens TaxID=65958 RepID=UPI000A055994|nr:RloB family protein [Komagataeibacter oboediens]